MNSPLSRTPKTLHAVALTITLSIAHLHAAPIPGLFNTGVDDTGAPLADGAIDAHYILTVNPDGGLPDAIVEDSTIFPIVAGPWVANSATSKWIGPRLNTDQAAGGDYEYLLTFDLTGFDPGTANINGRWATDNQGTLFLLGDGGGGEESNVREFASYTDFTLHAWEASFVEGINRIAFRVNNAAVGPTGLRVELSGTVLPPGAPPRIVDHPRSQIIGEGQQVAFYVLPQSNPTNTTFQWRFNGQNIPNETAPGLIFISATPSNA